MTFSKIPPSTPGFYAWKNMVGEVYALNIAIDPDDEWLAVFTETAWKPIPLGGEWCRLVPAEEVEKAWNEAGSSKALMDRVTAWQESRAKRVMEGKQ